MFKVYQDQINKKYGTKFNIPVTYYLQFMTVAYGGTAKGEVEAGSDPVDPLPRRTGSPRMASPGLSSEAG